MSPRWHARFRQQTSKHRPKQRRRREIIQERIPDHIRMINYKAKSACDQVIDTKNDTLEKQADHAMYTGAVLLCITTMTSDLLLSSYFYIHNCKIS